MSELVVYRYLCPLCTEGDMGPSVGRCLHCGGAGLTNDVARFPAHMIREAPVPPGVMRKPCPDCAFRPGSPELEDGGKCIPEDGPFWCHHGTAQAYGGAHQPYGAWHIDGHPRDIPLGELLCAGWWAKACGRPLPTEPFRDIDTRKEDRP
ncbi:hypothetical protein [Streptomyces coerulescens]|uniref:Uncharacterized protein n=1 Tax=Streptomyces coerulescens TaxID=29304 RepID=A0ABW0CR75_STRCD